jgi:hypothetical protein
MSLAYAARPAVVSWSSSGLPPGAAGAVAAYWPRSIAISRLSGVAVERIAGRGALGTAATGGGASTGSIATCQTPGLGTTLISQRPPLPSISNRPVRERSSCSTTCGGATSRTSPTSWSCDVICVAWRSPVGNRSVTACPDVSTAPWAPSCLMLRR